MGSGEDGGDDEVEEAKEKLSGDDRRATDGTDGRRSGGEAEVEEAKKLSGDDRRDKDIADGLRSGGDVEAVLLAGAGA